MIKISQWFGANPEYYAQFGLPGHDGIDFAGNLYPVFAVTSGVVYRVHTNPNTHNYGIHVRIEHVDGYKTIYSHLSSYNVSEDDYVNAGDIIGYSGNTGNSSGPHLHLGEKKEGETYIDEKGQSWPYNLRDPWLHLEILYSQWLQSNGVIGWVYSSGLTDVNFQGDYTRVQGSMNIRELPSIAGNKIGEVHTNSVVKLLGEYENGYYLVLTPLDESAPPNGASNPSVGLHLRADPTNISNTEVQEVQILKNGLFPNSVKLLHSHPEIVYAQMVSTGSFSDWIVRIFQSWGDRNITPSEFYNWNISELRSRVEFLQNSGVPLSNIHIELHNEPNLQQEGWGYSWNNGAEFITWAIEALSLFKEDSLLEDCKWMYPGLSPGTNGKYDSTAFLAEGQLMLYYFDSVGVHAYWSQPFPIQQALDHIATVQGITNKPIHLTEVSINDRPAVLTPEEYGEQYADFINIIKTRSNMESISFFVASASDPYFEPETFVTEQEETKGISASLVSNL